ncbi:ECF transporter S component [Candidatus Bathyarchaeota archaeon]|nr:ECF transporter S component [Candidatus Bathyarchaeota archaeon]
MKQNAITQKTQIKGIKTLNIAMIAVCAALYALIGRLTDLSITGPGGVAFWPAAVIPAVFATLFGPWVGGVGAAIGIFIRDMLFHGDALLSLSAGVTANFIGFFILGHIARSTLNWKKILTSAVVGSIIVVTGLLLPTVLLPAESQAYFSFKLSSLEITMLFIVTVVSSLLIVAVISKLWPDWRKYAVGSVMGLSAGSAIIAIVVWAYSQIFFGPTAYFRQPIPHSLIPIIFVWTFATEIPFMVILGPPMIKACYKAFPFLRPREEKKTT